MQDFQADQQQEPKSKRERVKALIRALLAKTTANGCTEEEAKKAADKASELMTQYDLSYEDAQQVRDEIIGKMGRCYGKKMNHEAADLSGTIAKFTTTKCYRWTEGYIYYVGHRQDVEIAHYLLDLFIACAEAEWQAFRKQHKGSFQYETNIRGRKAFMRGIVFRLAERMNELIKARHTQTGTNALVVLKGQLVLDRYAILKQQLGLTARRVSRRHYSSSNSNFQAGKAAGDRINITTGVGSGSATKRIS